VAGTVVETNGALEGDPALVNKDPYGAGWMIKLKLQNPADAATLLDAAAYEKHIGS
jgi:glycine cleavage system H protein